MNNESRREFVKKVSAASVAVILPAVNSRTADSNSEKPEAKPIDISKKFEKKKFTVVITG